MELNTLKEMIDYYKTNKPYMTGLSKILYFRNFTEEQKEIFKTVENIESILENEGITVSVSDYLSLVKDLMKKEGTTYSLTQKLVDVDERKINDSLHIYRIYDFVLNILDETTKEVKDSKVIMSETTIDEPVPFLQGHNINVKLINFLQDKNVLNALSEYPELVDNFVLNINKKRMAKLDIEIDKLKGQMEKLQVELDKIAESKQSIEDENYMLENRKTLSLINKSIEGFCKPIEKTNTSKKTAITEENQENKTNEL